MEPSDHTPRGAWLVASSSNSRSCTRSSLVRSTSRRAPTGDGGGSSSRADRGHVHDRRLLRPSIATQPAGCRTRQQTPTTKRAQCTSHNGQIAITRPGRYEGQSFPCFSYRNSEGNRTLLQAVGDTAEWRRFAFIRSERASRLRELRPPSRSRSTSARARQRHTHVVRTAATNGSARPRPTGGSVTPRSTSMPGRTRANQVGDRVVRPRAGVGILEMVPPPSPPTLHATYCCLCPEL